ncbi:MAG: hypothetical protein RLN90_11785 [Balneolaceae bacterium]
MEKGSGIAIGISIGVAIGVVTGSLGLWIGIGVVVGVLIENGELDEIFEKCGFEAKRKETE